MTGAGGGGRVVVVGSANVDRTAFVDAFPTGGETLVAERTKDSAGGKGLNQAVAASVAGADVLFAAALGDDLEGTLIQEALDSHGVRLARLADARGLRTGTAFIVVDRSGENQIVVFPGANRAHDSEATADAMREARIHLDAEYAVVVTQAEIPVETIGRAAALARTAGARFVLNLAPATAIQRDMLAAADPLVVNTGEARAVAGSLGLAIGAAPPEELCRELLRVSRSVIITLGADGAIIGDESGVRTIPAPRVAVVDTTGAGDAFVGVLAAQLGRGAALDRAAADAAAFASATVAHEGAADSYASVIGAGGFAAVD